MAGANEEDCQRERRDHEDDRGRCCGFAQDRAGTALTESGLSSAAAEGSGPIGAFALLQQDDDYQADTDDDMNYDNYGNHRAPLSDSRPNDPCEGIGL